MNTTTKEILNFTAENDVKFVRLSFCDPFGFHKNISILSEELEHAFEKGITIDGFAINGFESTSQCELKLFPIPSTLTVLPWRPDPGRVIRFYCDVKTTDGEKYDRDSRFILQKTLEKAAKHGYICKIGSNCEFYLFKTDENGEPTYETLDNGGYLDIAPLDKGENIRREICLTLEEMGLHPEKSYHEKGPGQNEIDFKYSDALHCADNLLTFKSVVKAIAARNGLFASFMPKPLADKDGSGLHINLSLNKNGENIFAEDAEIAKSFTAGILQKIEEITAFLNPNINSYERFGEMFAPSAISWSQKNTRQLITMPKADGDRTRVTLRSPDPTVNPYIAFALIISAGIYGIENNLQIDNDTQYDKDKEGSYTQLPSDLKAALDNAAKSPFVLSVLGENFLEDYIEKKKEEIISFENTFDKHEFAECNYFRRF